MQGHRRPVRPSGHLQVKGTRGGRKFFAFWTDADGRHQKTLGFAHVKDTGRKTKRGATIWRAAPGPKPDPSWLTPDDARVALNELLARAPKQPTQPPKHVRGRVPTFGDACDEWLRYIEHDKQRAPSYVRDCRNTVRGYLKPAFGERTPLSSITTDRIDAYRERLLEEDRLSRRTIQKLLVLLHGIFKRAKRKKWITVNPAEDAERVSVPRSGDFNVLEPEQVEAIARAAEQDAPRDAQSFSPTAVAVTPSQAESTLEMPANREDSSDGAATEKGAVLRPGASRALLPDAQLAAVIRVATYTGLRLGELRALRWSDVDFARRSVRVTRAISAKQTRVPKSGRVRSVPLSDQAMAALDALSKREQWTSEDDLVFVNELGKTIDDSKTRKGFYAALDRAGLGHLRYMVPPSKQNPKGVKRDHPMVFHDLRHTFGTLAVRVFPITDVMAFMGHQDISTTMIYVHHTPMSNAAERLNAAFRSESPTVAQESAAGDAPTGSGEARSG